MKIPFVWLFLAIPPEKYKLPSNTDYRTIGNQPLMEFSKELKYLIADV
jgi:hypothetical protein